MKPADERPIWQRMPEESPKAFQAFMVYRDMPPMERSIDAAYNKAMRKRKGSGHWDRASGKWSEWMMKYQWYKRVQAYDEHIANLEADKWIERRLQQREREWAIAEQLRDVVVGAIPTAEQFFRRSTARVPGTPTIVDQQGNVVRQGTAEQVITTINFDVAQLTNVAIGASKLGRLASNDPTENIKLHGAALEAHIIALLAELNDAREATDGDDPFADIEPGEGETEAEGVEPEPKE